VSDFETKKSVHINLTKSTHASLRIELIRRGLSMQETLDHLASLICENDPALTKKLDELELLKRNKQLSQVKNSDADSVYRMINQESPID
jgi:hypothetical protein